MSRRLTFVIAVELLLGGCCRETGRYMPAPDHAMSAWNVSHRISRAPLPKRRRAMLAIVPKMSATPTAQDTSPNEEDLAKLRPYSKEWGAALDAMNRAADAKLKKKLIICNGCLSPEPNDRISSITLKEMNAQD